MEPILKEVNVVMKKIKKYRVICNTQEEYDELKRIYPRISNTFKKSEYYCTWNIGRQEIFCSHYDYQEIKPITFKEWKQDYYKPKEIHYEIY